MDRYPVLLGDLRRLLRFDLSWIWVVVFGIFARGVGESSRNVGFLTGAAAAILAFSLAIVCLVPLMFRASVARVRAVHSAGS